MPVQGRISYLYAASLSLGTSLSTLQATVHARSRYNVFIMQHDVLDSLQMTMVPSSSPAQESRLRYALPYRIPPRHAAVNCHSGYRKNVAAVLGPSFSAKSLWYRQKRVPDFGYRASPKRLTFSLPVAFSPARSTSGLTPFAPFADGPRPRYPTH